MNALSGRLFVFLIIFLILSEGRAHAYVDPGTGSLLWQLLLATGVGMLFYLRKAIAWLLRLRKKASDSHRLNDNPGPETERGAGKSPPVISEDL